MRTTPILSLTALLVLAACGGDSTPMDGSVGDGSADARVPDMGRICPPGDGTAVGDCMHFDCALRVYSRGACGTAEYGISNCAALATLPTDYQTMVQGFFQGCEATFPTIMPADVDVGMGMTVHVSTCTISSCINKFNSQRLFMCMPGVFEASCSPDAVPSSCNFPDPPGYVCM